MDYSEVSSGIPLEVPLANPCKISLIFFYVISWSGSEIRERISERVPGGVFKGILGDILTVWKKNLLKNCSVKPDEIFQGIFGGVLERIAKN